MLAPFGVMFAFSLLFCASLGRRFDEHRGCIILGSIFNEGLNRPFGENLIFTMESSPQNIRFENLSLRIDVLSGKIQTAINEKACKRYAPEN